MNDPHCRSRWNRRSIGLLVVLWFCFLLRGGFYSALLPLWEGYDEPFHFSFIEYVGAHHSLPLATTPVSRDVQASLHLLPLSWEQRLHVLAPPIYTEDSYWQLPEQQRRELQEQVRLLPPDWRSQTGTAPTMYEAQQAPLYYWLMAVPTRLCFSCGLPARVLLVRWLSVLLASLLIPIAYLAAVAVLGSQAEAIGVVAVITCMPELMIDVSRAGNESLAIVVYSALTVLLLKAVQPRQAKWFAGAGLVLGIGLLSKAYFVLAIPAFLFTILYAAWRSPAERRPIAWNAFLGLAIAAALSSGWYWRNYSLTGSWSGEENDVAAVHGGLGQLFAAAAHVNWVGGVTSVLVSHVWFGGWSFLKFPRPVYLIFLAGMLAALIGLAKLIAKDRFCSPEFLILLVVYVCFWLGLLYDMLVVHIATGVSASDGWYMYAVVVPEVLLVACGLFAIVPKHFCRLILSVLAGIFACLDVLGVQLLLAPYYTGRIAHVPGTDLVPPMGLLQSLRSGPGLFLERLTVNKPSWLSAAVFAVLFVLYYAATFMAVAIAFRVARHGAESAA